MNKPKLRFKADDGSRFPDWEEKKLGNFGVATGGTSIESEFVSEGRYKVINIGSYSMNNVYKDQGLRVNKTNKTENRILKANDLTMILNDKTQAGNIIGRVLLIDKDDTYVYNQRTERIEVDESSFKSEFLYQYLNADNIRSKIVKSSQGNTQIYVNWSSISNITCNIPSLPEQQKIAEFLSTIDTVIEKQKEAVSAWEERKKGVMQKLFSQEVRFKADDGNEFPEWEEKKLSEIASIHARIGWQNLRKDEFLTDGNYLLITGTDFCNGRVNLSTCYYVDKERYEQDKNIQVEDGTILVTKDGTLGKVALVENLNKPATLNAGVFAIKVIHADTISKFLYHWLAAPMLLEYALKKSTGGTIKHLNQGILVDFPVGVPCLEEQQKIADCLSSLDEVIEKQKATLAAWEALKKGLLQQMFV